MPSEVKAGPIECLLAHADIGPREVVADALERIGMTVEAVGSIEECAQSLQRRQFNLIITSLKLADAEAWELERMVRGEDSCPPSMLIIVLCEASMYGHYLPIAQQRNCELIPEDDLSQLEKLVAQELGRRELEMARDVQRRLLPPSELAGPGWEVAARCQPARVVAGDFYDVLQRADGTVALVVADVAGKGFAASLIMASAKAMLPFITAEGSVAESLTELNRRLAIELGAVSSWP